MLNDRAGSGRHFRLQAEGCLLGHFLPVAASPNAASSRLFEGLTGNAAKMEDGMKHAVWEEALRVFPF